MLIMLREYILQNWASVMILLAFAVMLKTTVFLDHKVIRRMYILIIGLFVFSIAVFEEFYLEKLGLYMNARITLMAIRYSITPLIIAMILYTFGKNAKGYIFIPALVVAGVNFLSIPTGIVFSLDEAGQLHRGPLGYLPYIAVGVYSFILVFILFKQSNRLATETIPILFLSFSFISGLGLPFILGKAYSEIFVTTIVVALFIYYVFSILQLTSKDSLTGLLNRQAYYAAVKGNSRDITALVSIDMNGLKAINDTKGHVAGDEALKSLARCFLRAVGTKQPVYRIGGDEFLIVCLHTGEDEIKQLIERIEKNVSETEYKCAVGYSYCSDGTKDIDAMLKESDEMMYRNKAAFYENLGPGGHGDRTV